MSVHVPYPLWYWKSSQDPFSSAEEDKWNPYDDINNEIIERSFTQNAEQVELDNYIIDLHHLIQISKQDKRLQRPIKRSTNDAVLQCTLPERFSSGCELPVKSIGGIHWNSSRFVRHWAYQFKSVCLQQDVSNEIAFSRRAYKRGFEKPQAWFVAQIINNPRITYEYCDDESLSQQILENGLPSTIHRKFPAICVEEGYDCQDLHKQLKNQFPRPCKGCIDQITLLSSTLTTTSIKKLELFEYSSYHYYLILSENNFSQWQSWRTNLLSSSIKMVPSTSREPETFPSENTEGFTTNQTPNAPTSQPISTDNESSTDGVKDNDTRGSIDTYIDRESACICEDVSEMSTEKYVNLVNTRLRTDMSLPWQILETQPWWFIPGGQEPAYQYFHFTSLHTPYRNDERCFIHQGSLVNKYYMPFYGDLWAKTDIMHIIAPCFPRISLQGNSEKLYKSKVPFIRLELNDSSYPSCSNLLWVAYKNDGDLSVYSELIQCGLQLSRDTNTPLVCVTDPYPQILERNDNSIYGYCNEKPWQITEEHRLSWLKYVVDRACAGILEEGNLMREPLKGQFLVNHLQLALEYDQLWSQCIHLYTRDSFLSKSINQALVRDDIGKLHTLGPFCYLLHWSISSYSLNISVPFTGVVYRGMMLDTNMIKQYEESIGTYRSWLGFSSTSRNSRVAEIMGNTLFVISVHNGWACQDVSSVSQFPMEEEVLITAGATFQIKRVEFTNNKHVIYLEISDIVATPPSRNELGNICWIMIAF